MSFPGWMTCIELSNLSFSFWGLRGKKNHISSQHTGERLAFTQVKSLAPDVTHRKDS